MQDKRDVQELTDLGWGKMEAILDREMPQKKEKNRFFIWFFFGLGLALMSGFLHWSTTQNRSIEQSSASIQNEEINSNQTLTNSETTNSLALLNENPILNKSKDKVSAQSPEETLHNSSTSNEDKSNREGLTSPIIKNQKIEQSNGQEAIGLTGPNSKQIQNSNTVTLQPITLQVEEINEPSSPSSTHNSISTVKIGSTISKSKEGPKTLLPSKEKAQRLNQRLEIPFIKSIETTLLDLPWKPLEEERVPDIVYEQTIPAKTSKKFKLIPSLYAGAHFNPVFDLGGYEFGMLAKTPLSKKTSLSLGLGIADMNKKGFEKRGLFERGLVTDEFANPVVGGSGSFELDGLEKSEIASSIDKLVYLQIPIKLHHQLNKRFEIFGGANFGYLINASAVGSFPTVANGGDFQNQVELSTSELFSSSILRRWDTQFVGGVNIKLFKQLNFQASYRYGLATIVNPDALENANLNDNSVKDFNRTIFLGLNYTFGKR